MGKKAVLVGINYPGTKAQLNGCINDVVRMHKCLLDRYGFKEEDIVILIDTDPKYPQPTGANIRNALGDLIGSAESGDYLFFHYSGHGTRLPAETGDDDDTGYDECIVPCDMNLITDHDFRELVTKVPDGCTITLVSDSCHSGGLLDKAKEQIGESTKQHREVETASGHESGGGFRSFLKESVKDAFKSRGLDLHSHSHGHGFEPEEVEEIEGQGKNRSLPLSTLIEILQQKTGKDDIDVGNIRPTLFHMFGKDASPKFKKFMKVLFKRLQEGRLGSGHSGHHGLMGMISGLAHEVMKVKQEDNDEEDEEDEQAAYAGTTKKDLPNNGILISGCQSDQTSADANSGKGAYGACSNAIQSIISETKGEVSNKELVLKVRKRLSKEGFKQKPGLYCSDEHVDHPFIC